MSAGRSAWRLFIAAHPPEHVARAYLDTLATLDLPPHRPTPIAQVHLTLHFVGPVPARGVDGAVESVGRACAGLGAFTLTPSRLIALPERDTPRLVAMEMVPDSTASELHARLVRRLARSRARTGTLAYRPHLTLCRFTPAPFGPGPAPPRITREVALPGFSVERIRLLRSLLHAEGAEHREVASWALDGRVAE